jgi:hypothetical protein
VNGTQPEYQSYELVDTVHSSIFPDFIDKEHQFADSGQRYFSLDGSGQGVKDVGQQADRLSAT